MNPIHISRSTDVVNIMFLVELDESLKGNSSTFSAKSKVKEKVELECRLLFVLHHDEQKMNVVQAKTMTKRCTFSLVVVDL